MLTDFHVKNFKSVRDLRLEPGRVTVLIGENGSGKSNVLEALAFAGAAMHDKLDHEFLASRGIRLTEPRYMRSAFDEPEAAIVFTFIDSSIRHSFTLIAEGDGPYARWIERSTSPSFGFQNGGGKSSSRFILEFPNKMSSSERIDWLTRELESRSEGIDTDLEMGKLAQLLVEFADHSSTNSSVPRFLIYSPENTALRNFEHEGQILPLGIKGEGLFQLLKSLGADEQRLDEIRENLRLIDWFDDIRLASDLAPFERTLFIRDRYISNSQDDALAYFDQRSANEGFLFLLFYFALFISPDTPKLFAIDNIDASLNPKLCTELMRRITALAVKHDKQVIITTHNPAVLDGLDLNDDQQRLYTVYRNTKGHTRTRRVHAPKPIAGEAPIKLSDAFLRGLLGGLPQNF